MLRARPLLLALVLAACSDRAIEEERPSRRHLAAQWCEDWCTFWYACEPILHGRPVSECQERCEGDEAWDWTDHCGDLKWEVRECLASVTCEEARDDPEIEGADNPCQPYYDELVIQRCTYERPRRE
jgi:hypothetical protein